MTRIIKKILSYIAYFPVHQPWFFLIPLILGTVFFACYLPYFSLDATTDSLIIKDDTDFTFYNKTRENFTSDDYIIISFEDNNVLSPDNIKMISDFAQTVKTEAESIKSVESIATVPLFNSPPFRFKNKMLNDLEQKNRKNQTKPENEPIKLSPMAISMLKRMAGKILEDELANIKSQLENPATLGNVKERAESDLLSEGINKTDDNFETLLNQRIKEYNELGKNELLTHPIYSSNLISTDSTATSIIIQVPLDPDLLEAEKYRTKLKKEYQTAKETKADKAGEIKEEYEKANSEYLKLHLVFSDRRAKRLEKITQILKIFSVKYNKTFYLGGVPIIVRKMVSNLEHDIKYFGVGIVGLLALILFFTFFRLRWMIIPMITCIIVAIWVIGAMAFNEDRGNIITANAITIVFVIAMAHSIHLIIKFREYQNTHPELNKKEQLKNTLRVMFVPCFYTALTTAAGFSSFLITNIEPIINFGMYMTFGVLLALVVSFVAFPVGVMILGPSRPPKEVEEIRAKVLFDVARLSIKSRYWLIGLSVAIIGFSAYFINKLSIETKFGEYFDKKSDVYQGLYFIDNKVAGSSPLEIIFEAESGYFANPEHFSPVRKTMNFLETLPEVGKVDSIINLYDTIAGIRQNSFSLLSNPDVFKAVKESFPDDSQATNADDLLFSAFMGLFDRSLLKAYVNDDFSKARILLRVRETLPDLNRKQLLNKINNFLNSQNFKDAKPRATGIFLLYSNLLNSLAESQIKSFTLVFVAVFVMFLILFQSLRLALIGMIPNVLPILLVLGFMGFTGKPLDVLSVMIASVTMGIAVDSTIHYIFRFKHEFKRSSGDYMRAIYRAHQTIGQSITLTSAAVIGGFLILIFSNFVPTRFFGLFTAIAMFCALFASLSVLPSLIYIFKPLKHKDKRQTRFFYLDDLDDEPVKQD